MCYAILLLNINPHHNHLNRLGFGAAELAVAPTRGVAFALADAVGRIKLLPALPFRVNPEFMLGLLCIVLLVGLGCTLLLDVKLLLLLILLVRPPLWLPFRG